MGCAMMPLLALAAAGSAFGQAAPPPPPPAAPEAATQGPGLGEITVTATRRAESISKVTESVSAFSADKMDVLDVKNFADLAKFTPGVDFDQDSNVVSIRGIKSGAGSATTGIYIDDTPIQLRALGFNSNDALPDVFDLTRVEVLRGPQGTLFGAGSEGGTVRYITEQPSLTTYSGTVHTELSGTEDGGVNWEYGAAVGGPIIPDVLGFRLSGWSRHDSGYIDKEDPYTGQITTTDANSNNAYVVRAAVTWKPIDGLTITPSYNFEQRTRNDADVFWVGLSNPGSGRFVSGTPEPMRDPDRFDLGSIKIEYDTDDFDIISNTAYFSRMEYTQGYSGTLYNLSYFQDYISPGIANPYGYPSDPVGNPCLNNCQSRYPLLGAGSINLPGFGPYVSSNYITNSQRNLTQEIRAQSPDADAQLTWTLGVFYTYETQRSNEEINDPQLPALTKYLWGEDMLTAWGENLLPNGDDYINDTVGDDMQIAVFGDTTYKLTPELKADFGLRYAYTHFDFRNLNDGAQDLLLNGGYPALASGSKAEHPFTPKISLSYQITPNDMVYGTIAEGYRVGGASPPLPFAACQVSPSAQYNSDTTWSYEIGTKDKFLDGKLQLSASAYYIDWQNIQQNVVVTLCDIQYTTNLGNAISEGFDLEGQYMLIPDLTIDFSVGYTDAKYSNDSPDPANPGAIVASKGDSLGVVPWTVTIGAQYDFSVQDNDAFLRADWSYSSKRHRPNIYEDPRDEYYDPALRPDPATNTVQLRAGLIMDKLEVNLFVDNLFNSQPTLDLQHEDVYTRLFEAETFRPRTGGITATYHF